MASLEFLWRWGDPPQEQWSLAPPDAGATVVDSRGTDLPLTSYGTMASTPTPYSPSRSYRDRGNGDMEYVAEPGKTNIFDRRICPSEAGDDGKLELWGGCYWTDENIQKRDYIEFAVVDRDDVLGAFAYYGLSRYKLSSLTGVTGTFQVGETVTGALGGSAMILLVGSNYLEIRADYSGSFTDGDVLTGGTSGATATLGTLVPGVPLNLGKYVSKRHLAKSTQDVIAPGGSAVIYAGLYFRAMVVTVSSGVNREIFLSYGTAR